MHSMKFQGHNFLSMEKLSFIQKNDALVMLQSAEHYDADCALLAIVNPQSKLQNEIAKANEFNRNALHGRILLDLLDIIPIKEIQGARAVKGAKAEKLKVENINLQVESPKTEKAQKPKEKKTAKQIVPALEPEKKKDPKA